MYFLLLVASVLSADIESSLLSLINTARKSASLAPICLNKKLTQNAIIQNQLQAKYNILTHGDNQNPNTFAQRLKTVGYSFNDAGEILAFGFKNEQSVFQAWMNSTKDKEMILYSSFTQAGISRLDTTQGSFWIISFASSKVEVCDSSKPAAPSFKKCPPGYNGVTVDDSMGRKWGWVGYSCMV